MCKSRANRKRRLKRDKRFLEQMARKVLDPLLLKGAGKNPEYYKVVHVRTVIRKVGGVRRFNLRKSTCRIVPNEKFFKLIDELVALCGGITVDLSNMERGGE